MQPFNAPDLTFICKKKFIKQAVETILSHVTTEAASVNLFLGRLTVKISKKGNISL